MSNFVSRDRKKSDFFQIPCPEGFTCFFQTPNLKFYTQYSLSEFFCFFQQVFSKILTLCLLSFCFGFTRSNQEIILQTKGSCLAKVVFSLKGFWNLNKKTFGEHLSTFFWTIFGVRKNAEFVFFFFSAPIYFKKKRLIVFFFQQFLGSKTSSERKIVWE